LAGNVIGTIIAVIGKIQRAYFGHQLTQKSKILGFTVIHQDEHVYQFSTKSQMVMCGMPLRLYWNCISLW